MKNRNSILVLILLICIIGIGYLIYYYSTTAQTTMKTASLVSNLGAIRDAAMIYQNEYGRFPNDFKKLDLDKNIFKDPFSNKTLVWMPNIKHDLDSILLAQPVCFNTTPWPFFKHKRYALLYDGQIIEIDSNCE
jgi:hypothetical protein